MGHYDWKKALALFESSSKNWLCYSNIDVTIAFLAIIKLNMKTSNPMTEESNSHHYKSFVRNAQIHEVRTIVL